MSKRIWFSAVAILTFVVYFGIRSVEPIITPRFMIWEVNQVTEKLHRVPIDDAIQPALRNVYQTTYSYDACRAYLRDAGYGGYAALFAGAVENAWHTSSNILLLAGVVVMSILLLFAVKGPDKTRKRFHVANGILGAACILVILAAARSIVLESGVALRGIVGSALWGSAFGCIIQGYLVLFRRQAKAEEESRMKTTKKSGVVEVLSYGMAGGIGSLAIYWLWVAGWKGYYVGGNDLFGAWIQGFAIVSVLTVVMQRVRRKRARNNGTSHP